MQAFRNHGWPGNIRELTNVLERAQILAEEHLVTLDDLPETLQTAPPPTRNPAPDSLNLREMERRNVQTALQQTKGNKVHAAKLLGITRRALYRLITRYGLERKQEEVGAASN